MNILQKCARKCWSIYHIFSHRSVKSGRNWALSTVLRHRLPNHARPLENQRKSVVFFLQLMVAVDENKRFVFLGAMPFGSCGLFTYILGFEPASSRVLRICFIGFDYAFEYRGRDSFFSSNSCGSCRRYHLFHHRHFDRIEREKNSQRSSLPPRTSRGALPKFSNALRHFIFNMGPHREFLGYCSIVLYLAIFQICCAISRFEGPSVDHRQECSHIHSNNKHFLHLWRSFSLHHQFLKNWN